MLNKSIPELIKEYDLSIENYKVNSFEYIYRYIYCIELSRRKIKEISFNRDIFILSLIFYLREVLYVPWSEILKIMENRGINIKFVSYGKKIAFLKNRMIKDIGEIINVRT